MDEVVRIAPLQDDPGLIGSEGPSCRYVSMNPKSQGTMTTLTLRYIKGDFLVTGPDIEPEVGVGPRGQELVHDSLSRVSRKGDREGVHPMDRRLLISLLIRRALSG